MKKRKLEKPYRAMNDPVMRAIAPKAALKHDVNSIVVEVACEIGKEAWKGLKSLLCKKK